MALTAPLDLKQHFITVLAGSAEIFTFVAIFIVAIFMSRFNFSNKVSLAMFALFGVIMATYLSGIYVLIILLIGIVTYYSLAKIVR